MQQEQKHAFLIMAHTNWNLVGRLISRLDHRSHVLILHIDQKARFTDEDKTYLTSMVKTAKLVFVDRYPITWGGYSQILCELRLIREALSYDCNYLHFLSGVDYPIKSMDAFHKFFSDNAGKEFVNFASSDFTMQEKYRHSVFHCFQDIVGRNPKHWLYFVEKILVKAQLIITSGKGWRDDKTIKYACGSNWCSITQEFAKYVSSQDEIIKKLFRYSFCCDEFFVQTMLINSPFYENWIGNDRNIQDYEQCLRFIDWKRGNPYVFDIQDYDVLVNSSFIFCRKVGTETKSQIELLNRLDELDAI